MAIKTNIADGPLCGFTTLLDCIMLAHRCKNNQIILTRCSQETNVNFSKRTICYLHYRYIRAIDNSLVWKFQLIIRWTGNNHTGSTSVQVDNWSIFQLDEMMINYELLNNNFMECESWLCRCRTLDDQTKIIRQKSIDHPA